MRSEYDRIRGALSRVVRDPGERPSWQSRKWLGVVLTASPVAETFILVQPQKITGDEVEGGPGTITDDATVEIPVYLLRGTVSQGDEVVVHWVNNRWITERNPSGGGTVPDCICWSTGGKPTTLSYSIEYHCVTFGIGSPTNVTLGTVSGTLTYSGPPLTIPTTDGPCKLTPFVTADQATIDAFEGWIGPYCYKLNNPAGSAQDCVSRPEERCDGDTVSLFGGDVTWIQQLVFSCDSIIGSITEGNNYHGFYAGWEELGCDPSPNDNFPVGPDREPYISPTGFGGTPTITYSCDPFIYTCTWPDGTKLTITE